jgi:UDP-N-acetylmuramoyl-L-alanyl-D-glutamate--2,6-diaminopimelate ligase
VAGLRRAGPSAARALLAEHPPQSIACWDAEFTRYTESARDELQADAIRVDLGGDGTSLLAGSFEPRCIVKSPGIPFAAPILRVAARRRIDVIDELELGWRRCGSPVVGVTGTNGKSTTVALIQSALRCAGVDAPLAGNTHFGPPLSGLESGAGQIVVCEVSSFQLEGCPEFMPEVSVLTNLTPEHLDRHGTMERYVSCKARMFVKDDRAVPLAAVSIDNPMGRRLRAEVARRGGTAVGFGAMDCADYRLERSQSSLKGGVVAIRTPAGRVLLETRLPGPHNAQNITAAFAVCDAMGVDRRYIEAAISSARGVPGRLEPVDGSHPFSVLVDFAHNEAGVRAVVRTAREVLARQRRGRLRAVVSAAVFFDSAQRLAIGRVARQSTDHLILTSDRWPGDPPGVSEELVAGAADATGAELQVVEDRREAIEIALRASEPGDVVLIVGRGPAVGPLVDALGREARFDDREVARELLRELAPAAS